MNAIVRFVFILNIFLLIGCAVQSAKQLTSRVENFEYQGYGDTIVSMLFGSVYELKAGSEKDLVPLQHVIIKVEQDSLQVQTDSAGKFVIALPEGVYALKVSKKGYQSICLRNYVSHSDRVSLTSIILVKGKDQQDFIIPPSSSQQ